MKSGRVRTLKSAKYLEKRKKKFIGLILIYISGSILFLVLIYGFFRIPFFQISTIVINGASTIDKQSAEYEVRSLLQGNYFGLIPKTNFLFYPKSQILSQLPQNYKKIESASSNIKGTSVLYLEIVERQVKVIVCDGFKDDDATDRCFYADDSGFVFDKVDDFLVNTDNVKYFKYYVNSNLNPVAIGSNFIEKGRFIELQKFIKDVGSAGIKATGLLVSDDGSYELYVDNINQTPAVVYFDDRTPFDKTLSDFVIFWQNAIDKKLGLKTVPIFDYINLRFGNNVFYLIKNGTSTKP